MGMYVCVCVFIRVSKGRVTKKKKSRITAVERDCSVRKQRRIWRKHYSQVPKGKFTPENGYLAISDSTQKSHER